MCRRPSGGSPSTAGRGSRRRTAAPWAGRRGKIFPPPGKIVCRPATPCSSQPLSWVAGNQVIPHTERATKMDFRLEVRRYRLPFRHAVRTAHGPWGAREGLFVRMERPGGPAAYGEASPLPQSGGETVDADEAFCRSLGDRVDDQVLSRVPRTLCALRNALACAMGGREGEPRHRSLAVAALIPAGRAALEAAPGLGDAGFRVFKWKVGVGDAEDERAILDDLIGALPSGSRLRLDANGGWDR